MHLARSGIVGALALVAVCFVGACSNTSKNTVDVLDCEEGDTRPCQLDGCEGYATCDANKVFGDCVCEGAGIGVTQSTGTGPSAATGTATGGTTATDGDAAASTTASTGMDAGGAAGGDTGGAAGTQHLRRWHQHDRRHHHPRM